MKDIFCISISRKEIDIDGRPFNRKVKSFKYDTFEDTPEGDEVEMEEVCFRLIK